MAKFGTVNQDEVNIPKSVRAVKGTSKNINKVGAKLEDIKPMDENEWFYFQVEGKVPYRFQHLLDD